MKNEFLKIEVIEMIRKWDLPAINLLLDEDFKAHDMVIAHKTDVLLESIVRKSKPLFIKLINKDFNYRKNKFLYLHHAIRTNEIFFVEKLLEKFSLSLINKIDPINKNSALHVACTMANFDILSLLNKYDLNWNLKNNLNQTPFHILLRTSLFIPMNVQERILDKKINIDLKDKMNISCRDIIKSFSHDKQWLSYEENQRLLKII